LFEHDLLGKPVSTFPDHAPGSENEQTNWADSDKMALYRPTPLAHSMRMFGAFLIVIAVIYFWDAEYNNGKLTDGARSMGRSIVHSMAP
jgi:hypothetical protein